MSKNKSTISKSNSYNGIAEFWETHDLSDYWDKTEEEHFEVDIQSEVILYAIDNKLSKKVDEIAQKHGISGDTLLNMWVQEKILELDIK